MPRKAKPDPEKYCERCGVMLHRKRYGERIEDMTRFLQRKYCSSHCASLRGIRSKKIGPQHRISQTLRKEHCEFCGKTPANRQHLHAHHINGDWKDHRPENIQTLCVGCHLNLHKRKCRLCVVCGEKARKRRMCQKHFQRWKKYGNPLLTKKQNGNCFKIVLVGPMD